MRISSASAGPTARSDFSLPSGQIVAATLFLLLAGAVAPAQAQTAVNAQAQPVAEPQPGATHEPAAEPPAEGFWDRDTLLGDLGGLRSGLAAHGIVLGVQEQSEVLGNVSGGMKRTADYEGLTTMTLSIDTAKAVGIPGGKFYASAFQIHGHGLTPNIEALNTLSSIEATATTRLFELWYDQTLFDGVLSLRVGQQAADQEFIMSQYAMAFINAGFGWPTLAALNLPSGGPAFPLGTPAVRVKVVPNDSLTFLAGVYNGNPAGTGDDNPQVRNANGTAFLVNNGVLAIGEVQYAHDQGDGATGLPGTFKLGGWYNSNTFPDLRYANDGLSLANPDSNGTPLSHQGTWSLYGVADQLVWRKPGTKDGGLGVFARVLGASGAQNLIDVSINAGATYKGLLPGRDADTLGLGIAYARVSGAARGINADTAFYTGIATPARTAETVLELTYQAQITPWWQIQPDFQYVFNPGGGVVNPENPSQSIHDAAIFGLRTTIVF